MPAYRDKLTPRQTLALTVYLRAFAVPEKAPSVKPPTRPPVEVAVERMPPIQVYRAFCLACHDADGRGNTVRKIIPEIPDFTSAKWQEARTDAEVKQSILAGKGKFMAPMKDRLNQAEAEQMVKYVRAFREGKQTVKLEPQQPHVVPPPTAPVVVPGPKKPPVAPPADVQSAELAGRMRVATGLYRQYCLSCHGSDGKGLELKAAMPMIPDFTSAAWQASVDTPRLRVSILDGKGTLMPTFRGRVSEDQSRDLVAHVRAFGPARPAPVEASTDFSRRFRELQSQWDELQRQLQELRRPPPRQ